MTTKNTRRGFTQERVNKNCHSRKFLSGISTTFNNKKGEDPQRHSSGMMKHSVRGFTLIDLLAAVALPQYQKATQKARGAAVIPLVKALSGPYEKGGFYYIPSREAIGILGYQKAEGFGCLEYYGSTHPTRGFWCNKLWGLTYKNGGSNISFFQ